MFVKDLIKRLQKEDPDMLVLVNGYECGYDDIKHVMSIKTKKNIRKSEKYWEGDYMECHEDNDCKIQALLLCRN